MQGIEAGGDVGLSSSPCRMQETLTMSLGQEELGQVESGQMIVSDLQV